MEVNQYECDKKRKKRMRFHQKIRKSTWCFNTNAPLVAGRNSMPCKCGPCGAKPTWRLGHSCPRPVKLVLAMDPMSPIGSALSRIASLGQAPVKVTLSFIGNTPTVTGLATLSKTLYQP